MQALTFNPQTDEFKQRTVAIPTVGDCDVLIKVDACGLNPVDAKIALWKSMMPDMHDHWVPGLDVSGHIVATGDKVEKWHIGDRVLCHGDMFRPHGGFAEFSVQDAEILIPHPKQSATVAAATPCAGWTAWRALNDKLRARKGNSILITGGAGGVGGFATQIASHLNLEKIIVTCSAANGDYVKSLGATHVIDYNSEDVVARVMAITSGQGVDLGFDVVGPDNDIVVANSLRFEGQMLELVDTVRPVAYQDAFMKGLSFHQLSLGAGHRNGQAAKATLTTAGNALSALLDQGAITTPVLKTISLEQVAAHLNDMLRQKTVGKIVLSMAEN